MHRTQGSGLYGRSQPPELHTAHGTAGAPLVPDEGMEEPINEGMGQRAKGKVHVTSKQL